MAPSKLTVTHITTATTILDVDGIKFLTDPFFGPQEGSSYDNMAQFEKHDLSNLGLTSIPPPPHFVNTVGPALRLDELPPIDAILLSHEDHIDNLDPEGRKLLDGRKVFTSVEGASNLRPRPGVVGLRPRETITSTIGGKVFRVTGTPCKHFPIGEVSGFILETESFGLHSSGKPNAIWFSGDTVYIDELKEIRQRWHITAALLNLGNATVDFPVGKFKITMDDGKDAVRITRDIGADVMIPVHFEGWEHFTEGREELKRVFEDEGFEGRVCWTTPGVPKEVY